MMKKILLIAVCIISSQAFADHCLENASSSDLLAEIGSRLQGGGAEEGVKNVSVFCNGYYIVMSQTSENGTEKVETESLASAGECARQIQLIGRISAYRNGNVVSFCNNYNMIRIQVRRDNMVRLNSISMSNQAECEVQARNANRP